MYSRYALLWKVLTLVGLVLVMLIPMGMIMELIYDRYHYQQEVIQSVEKSSSGAQRVIGPIIVLPYTETVVEIKDKQRVNRDYQRVRYFLPQALNVTANADISPRHIGIYQTQIFQTDLNFSGHFSDIKFTDIDNMNVVFGQPYLVVMISDTRGIMQVPLMTLDKQEFKFNPGIKESGFGRASGVHSMFDSALLEKKELPFNFSLQILGTRELSIVPIASSTQYTLTGNWPHPNFVGDILPTSRTITDDSFTATWQSSWYANNINAQFIKDRSSSATQQICSEYSSDCYPSFKTSFVETVDQYQLTERAVKYEILFVALTFISFFIFEVIKQLRIHPIQYLLVGMALALFYLLLLALSEHIGFMAAYIIGAIACSGLIGFYLSAILKGALRGFIFSLCLLGLYTVLYFVMISEGNALLLGTVLLFIVLGGIMVITRRIDWYQLAQPKVKTAAKPVVISDAVVKISVTKDEETNK